MLKNSYYNFKYSVTQNSGLDITECLASSPTGEYLTNPKILFLETHLPAAAQNFNELIIELQTKNFQCGWFSYRKNFQKPLPGSKLTTDSGWGCMFRTVQMMVHEALKRHLLNSQKELFLDFEESPLSVHNLCRHSKKPAGEYLGP